MLHDGLAALVFPVHPPACQNVDDPIVAIGHHSLDVSLPPTQGIEHREHVVTDCCIQTAQVKEVEVASAVPAGSNEQCDALDLSAVTRFSQVKQPTEGLRTQSRGLACPPLNLGMLLKDLPPPFVVDQGIDLIRALLWCHAAPPPCGFDGKLNARRLLDLVNAASVLPEPLRILNFAMICIQRILRR